MLVYAHSQYTYDFVDENLGFVLIFGCMCFYPFFYGIGVYPMVAVPVAHDQPLYMVLAAVSVYLAGRFQHTYHPSSPLSTAADTPHVLAGYALTRGANLQKYYFKLDPKAPEWKIQVILAHAAAAAGVGLVTHSWMYGSPYAHPD